MQCVSYVRAGLLRRPFENVSLHRGKGAHLQAWSEESVKTVNSHCCKGVE